MKTPARFDGATGAGVLAGPPQNTTTVADLIARTDIRQVWQALGGGELRSRRGRAFWREGKSSRSISIDEAKGAWYDHGEQRGGGVLDLIQILTGTDRRAALQWLADHHGVRLDRQTPAQTTQWRRRRTKAERQAADLAAWRQAERRRLIEQRNHHYDMEACASVAGRLLLAEGAAASESDWALVWRHALADHEGDAVQARLDAVEAMTPGELAAYRARSEAVQA